MAERIAYANKLLVLHPRFREAVALLERCHQPSKQVGERVSHLAKHTAKGPTA
jgi:hypothetical protein